MLVALTCSSVYSQNVAINTTGVAPDASAGLDVSFTNKGFLAPRLTSVQKAAITSPATGLLIYQTDSPSGFYYYSGTIWLFLGTQWTPLSNNIYFNSGNVGIGSSSNPNYALTVGAISNPLFLSGVQEGLNSDSILVIAGGVVKKRSTSAVSVSNAWSLTGNSAQTSTYNTGSYIGTSDANALRFRTDNTQRMHIDASGNVAIGSNPTLSSAAEKFLVDAGTTTSYNVISGKGSIDNYLQLNIQNMSNTASASADVVASNSSATESFNFIDMGINSPSNSSTNILGGASTAYLYSTGGDFAIGNGISGKPLKFFTGGTATTNERMHINSAGKIGIGTSSFTALSNANGVPEEKVLIDAGTYGSGLNVQGAINDFFQVQVRNRSTGNNASSDFVVSSDNTDYYVDFGINGSGYTLNKSNILNQPYTSYLYASSPEHFFIGNGAPAKGIIFFTNGAANYNDNNSADGTERMIITKDGIVGIGYTSTQTNNPNTPIDVNYLLSVNSKVLATGYGTSSDRRLKKNIEGLKYGLSDVLKLRPVSYNWIDPSQTKEKQLGLIAQEARDIIPELVSGDESKEKLSVNYTELVPVLINAIKEQQQQIDDLKKQVEALKK